MSFFNKVSSAATAFHRRSVVGAHQGAYLYNLKNGYLKRADQIIEELIEKSWDIPIVEKYYLERGIFFADFSNIFNLLAADTKGLLIKNTIPPIWLLVDNRELNNEAMISLGMRLSNYDFNGYNIELDAFINQAISLMNPLSTRYEFKFEEFQSSIRLEFNELERRLISTGIEKINLRVSLAEEMSATIWKEKELMKFYSKLGLSFDQFQMMHREWCLSPVNTVMLNKNILLSTHILIDNPDDHDMVLTSYLYGFGSTNASKREVVSNIKNYTDSTFQIIKDSLPLDDEQQN